MFTRRNIIQHTPITALALTPLQSMAQTKSVAVDSLAADLPGITLPAGRHVVASNLTVRADVFLMPGAIIDVAAGKTLTLLGDFRAPIGRVFTGQGRIDLNRSRATEAYPEWWGAGRDDSQIDSLPALQACVAAHPITILGAADYFISATWKIALPHRRIWGAGKYWHGPNQGTRIVVTNGQSDVIQIGFDTAPSAPNNYLQSIDIRWLEVSRSAAPEGRDAAAAAGMRIRFVLNCLIEGISASEHAIGFSLIGAVRSYIRDCQAFRSVSAVGEKKSNFWGFHLDGRTDIGLAGGNASLFLIDCNASLGGAPALSECIGAFVQGGFADSFLINFETSGVATGIVVDGMASTLGATQTKKGHANLHIAMPVIDGFSKAGIDISNVSQHGVIDITDPYIGSGIGTFAGIFLHDCKGMTTITGGQLVGWLDAENGGNAIGIYCLNAEGIGIEGTKLLGFRRPIGFDRCSDFTINAAINNPAQVASQAAIWLKDCSRAFIRTRIKGRTNAFPQGIYLRSGNTRLSIDCIGIDPKSIQGGASNCFQAEGVKSGVKIPSIAVTGLDN